MNTDRMSCAEVMEKIPLFVGGDLDTGMLESLRAHLSVCGGCARRAGAAERARRTLVAAFRAREADTLRPDLWPGIRSVLRSEGLIRAGGEPAPSRRSESRTARRSLRILVPLAAAAALFAVIELGGWLGGSPSEGPRPRYREGPEIAPDVAVEPVGTGLRRVSPGDEDLTDRGKLYVRPQRQGALRRLAPSAGEPSLVGLPFK